MRLLWGIFGTLALGLGLLGAVLPLLPTVPFLILAAFCYSRFSERLHDWLVDHDILGPVIRDWRQNGSIRRRAKYAATLSIVLVFGVSLWIGVPAPILGIQAVVLSLVLLFIWSRPEA